MAQQRIITDQDVYPISPADINTNSHFYDAFGKMEKEISANCIVRLCQKNGGWKPFTRKEIGVFSREKYSFRFNGLDQLGGEIVERDGVYFVTHEFICACFKSSPNFNPAIQTP